MRQREEMSRDLERRIATNPAWGWARLRDFFVMYPQAAEDEGCSRRHSSSYRIRRDDRNKRWVFRCPHCPGIDWGFLDIYTFRAAQRGDLRVVSLELNPVADY